MSDAQPAITKDGNVVLYRFPGDVWQVAEARDFGFLLDPSRPPEPEVCVARPVDVGGDGQ